MRPVDTAFSRTRARRGFNLVEAAIVLGVVGLVIGGVWAAASAVKSAQIFEDQIAGIFIVNENIRSLYKGQDTTVTTRLDLNQAILQSVFAGTRGFTIRTGFCSSGGTYIESALGGCLFLRIVDDRIVWDFSSSALQKEDCIRLISRITASDKRITLIRISGALYFTFPMIPTADQCSGGIEYISFSF